MGYFMIQKVSHKTFKVQTNNYVRTKKKQFAQKSMNLTYTNYVGKKKKE